MNRDRFIYLCQENEAGRDAFAVHPTTREEGIVTACSLTSGHLVVRTPENTQRCWDFSECEELPLAAAVNFD